jgi:hypothetical protein
MWFRGVVKFGGGGGWIVQGGDGCGGGKEAGQTMTGGGGGRGELSCARLGAAGDDREKK